MRAISDRFPGVLKVSSGQYRAIKYRAGPVAPFCRRKYKKREAGRGSSGGGKVRFVRVYECVYRKFSGSTSARTHREAHHVDFKPSLICASSRTNFPLSLYPAPLSSSLRTILLRALLFPPSPRLLSLDFFSFFPSSSSLFLLLGTRHKAHMRATPRDLHRRMCWDNLVVIVLSLSPSPPRPRFVVPAELCSLSSSSGEGRVSLRDTAAGRVQNIFPKAGSFVPFSCACVNALEFWIEQLRFWPSWIETGHR